MITLERIGEVTAMDNQQLIALLEGDEEDRLVAADWAEEHVSQRVGDSWRECWAICLTSANRIREAIRAFGGEWQSVGKSDLGIVFKRKPIDFDSMWAMTNVELAGLINSDNVPACVNYVELCRLDVLAAEWSANISTAILDADFIRSLEQYGYSPSAGSKAVNAIVRFGQERKGVLGPPSVFLASLDAIAPR